MSARTIDLNCDLGEIPALIDAGVDRELLSIVTSANIACGGHAGDEQTMRRTVRDAIAAGVAIGAHPSFPDRENFGRLEMAMSPQEIEASVREQIAVLGKIAREEGAELRHVKPHGALYHAVLKSVEMAKAIARAAGAWSPSLILVEQAKATPPSDPSAEADGLHPLDLWRSMGFRVAGEAFADRRYEPDGSLRARSREGAVLHDAREVAGQAVGVALGRGVLTSADTTIPLRADTICVHGDTPGAVAMARAVRTGLEAAGVRCG